MQQKANRFNRTNIEQATQVFFKTSASARFFFSKPIKSHYGSIDFHLNQASLPCIFKVIFVTEIRPSIPTLNS